ncbi:MAG: hypothetical protein LUF00_08895 [Lachnospiraceae bacterium]|nr:hypothetical protein [Lachnospiraceae bacterium]
MQKGSGGIQQCQILKIYGKKRRSTLPPKQILSGGLQTSCVAVISDDLKSSAKNNTEKDFEFSYYSYVDDSLIEGLSQNQDFFELLLNNDEIKKQVLSVFAGEIYNSLRKGGDFGDAEKEIKRIQNHILQPGCEYTGSAGQIFEENIHPQDTDH